MIKQFSVPAGLQERTGIRSGRIYKESGLEYGVVFTFRSSPSEGSWMSQRAERSSLRKGEGSGWTFIVTPKRRGTCLLCGSTRIRNLFGLIDLYSRFGAGHV